MKVLLAGPVDTAALRDSLGLTLRGAPQGTAQTPIAPLAGALRRAGIGVSIVTFDPSIDETVKIEESGIELIYVPLRAGPKFRARVRSGDMFEREICFLKDAYLELAPDIVHAHWTYEFAEAAVRSGLPHVVTMHDIGWLNVFLYRQLYRVMRLAMMLRVMPRIRNLTVVAPFMKLHARLHGYLGPIEVVPNGVKLPTSGRSAEDVFAARPRRIVSIGDRTRRKNIDASVRAFRQMRSDLPDVELHLFGPGLDDSFTKSEPGLFGHGQVAHPELMAFLQNEASLLIHPSLQETFGVIIAEAMARGLPAIAGKSNDGVNYLTADGAVANLVDITKPHAIAQAAKALLTEEMRFIEASRLARNRIASAFAIDAVAKSYILVYQSVQSRVSGT